LLFKGGIPTPNRFSSWTSIFTASILSEYYHEWTKKNEINAPGAATCDIFLQTEEINKKSNGVA
jgi:hypothetical protein